MNKRISVFVVIVSFILFSANFVEARGYHSSLKHMTKKDSVYGLDNFSARLIWRATFFSDDFRKSFEKKHISINHLGALEAAKFVAEQEYLQSKGWTFFIGFYTRKEYKQFTSGKDSFWKIDLITQFGERVTPIEIDSLPVTPYERIMFPYLNRWSRAYKIVFPKVKLGKKFKLFLYSVVADSTLKWKMK